MTQHRKTNTEQLSVYIPTGKKGDRIIQRFIELATAQERSVNHLCIKALTEYLDSQVMA